MNSMVRAIALFSAGLVALLACGSGTGSPTGGGGPDPAPTTRDPARSSNDPQTSSNDPATQPNNPAGATCFACDGTYECSAQNQSFLVEFGVSGTRCLAGGGTVDTCTGVVTSGGKTVATIKKSQDSLTICFSQGQCVTCPRLNSAPPMGGVADAG